MEALRWSAKRCPHPRHPVAAKSLFQPISDDLSEESLQKTMLATRARSRAARTSAHARRARSPGIAGGFARGRIVRAGSARPAVRCQTPPVFLIAAVFHPRRQC